MHKNFKLLKYNTKKDFFFKKIISFFLSMIKIQKRLHEHIKNANKILRACKWNFATENLENLAKKQSKVDEDL